MTSASRPFAGKRALITGSTSGIGFGIAHALASGGAEIFLNGLGEPDAIEAARQEIRSAHEVPVTFLKADLRKAEEVEGMMAEAARLGGVDILVNNAGAIHVGPIEEYPLKRWEMVMAINLTAAFMTMGAAVPTMRERGWGRIVNTSSALGRVGLPNRAAYVASKHGLIGLTKVVALETAGTGVTCNAICPGLVDTPAIRFMVERNAKQQQITPKEAEAALVKDMQPDGTLVKLEEVAALVAFLCSDLAASITGTAHSVDRGWTAR